MSADPRGVVGGGNPAGAPAPKFTPSFSVFERLQAARIAQLEDALRQYANPQHWGISRDDLNYRVISWIGPGAEKDGMPDAMQVAREALDA